MSNGFEKLLEFFTEKEAEDISDKLFNSIYSIRGGGVPVDKRISMTVSKLNALNSEAIGTLTIEKEGEEDVEYEFHLKDGDNNGSEVISFGTSIHVPPLTSTVMVAKPKSRGSLSDKEWAFYLEKFEAKKSEIEKLAKNYNYDRYFHTGSKINHYYVEKAQEMDFVWEYEEVVIDR